MRERSLQADGVVDVINNGFEEIDELRHCPLQTVRSLLTHGSSLDASISDIDFPSHEDLYGHHSK